MKKRPNLKPIINYCKQELFGWTKLPDLFTAASSDEVAYSCSFLRQEDGVQMMASVKHMNSLNVIHVSLAPVRSLRRDWSDEEHSVHVFDVTYQVIESCLCVNQTIRPARKSSIIFLFWKNMSKCWRIWCKTMGSRITDNDFESDIAAVIRTFFWILNVITCGFIIANCIRHW